MPLRRRSHRRFRYFEHDLRVGADIRRAHADVVHNPAQHPLRVTKVPTVQTLHDLTPLVRRDALFARDRRRWRRYGPRLRDMAAVIADSQFSADQSIAHFGVDPSRLHVVPLGVDARFRPPAARGAVDPPYLLVVGGWGPHKGFDEAISVTACLAERGYPHRLHIAGAQDAWMRAHVDDAVRRGACPERVDVLGFVDDLASVYQQASALLMTSRAEGFGLPVVEAMACGTPVVSFANTSLPEVAGDAAVLVADGDVDAFTSAVARLLDDQDEWNERSAAGIARARLFDWATTAKAHAEIYRAVARA
jgi:glycosyltransferase involved in cell wall biosynthesis